MTCYAQKCCFYALIMLNQLELIKVLQRPGEYTEILSRYGITAVITGSVSVLKAGKRHLKTHGCLAKNYQVL